MALVAQPFDCRDNDDRKNNRDDGDGSESDSSSDDEEKPQKKKVMFVRCKKCIDKKNMVSFRFLKDHITPGLIRIVSNLGRIFVESVLV